MKLIYTFIIVTILTSCSLNDDAGLNENNEEEVVVGFQGTFVQQDRLGRPAINTALINSGRKDAYNIALTRNGNSLFKDEMREELMNISPAFNTDTDANALGQTASTLADLLATDVLNVSFTGETTFFDGVNVLTGRKLTDDVMDVELLLIFGGEDGTENPTLSSDNVNGNDRDFNNSFPYLPLPW